MDYGEIIVTSWKITWKQKWLWLFGLVVSFSQVINIGNQIFRILLQGRVLPEEAIIWLGELLSNSVYGFIIGMVVLACGLMFVMLLFSSAGQIGLIKGIALADGTGNENLTFGSLLAAIKTYFGRIFGLSLAVGFGFLVLFLAFYAIVAALFIGAPYLTGDFGLRESAVVMGLSLVCIMPLFCVLMIISMVVSAIMLFMFIAIINDGLGIAAAFAKSLQIIRKNFWKIVLFVILIGAIGGMLGFLMSIPISITSFTPLFALGSSSLGGTVVWLSILCLVAYAPILVGLNALFAVYTNAVWTLLYRRLTADGLAVGPG